MTDALRYVNSPFTVVIDTREQYPYSFTGLAADADRDKLPLVVPTVMHGLATGDYSIHGFEDRVCVERKSLEDLYGTLGQGRDRFQREFERMADMEFAALVIEAGWETILTAPPAHSRLNPKTVYRTAIAWQQRYPNVHWWALPTRSLCEKTTYRILDRFFQDAATKD